MSTITTDFNTQSGAPKVSKANSATWATTQPRTTYAIPTRTTLRLLSSEKNDIQAGPENGQLRSIQVL